MRIWITKLASTIGILVLSLGFTVACFQGRAVATPEDFYRGKNVTWIASSDAGSGTDLFSRALAPYLAKEIGATVKVENMAPDEGQNYVYSQGPRDGLMLVLNSTGAIMSNDILKAPGTKFEAEKFNFISDVNPTSRVMALSPKLPYKTLDPLRQAKALKAGATSARGSIAISAAVMFEILDLDGKVITGYKGTKDLSLGIARGEIDFLVSSDNSAKKDEQDGFLVNLLVTNKERSKTVPHLPTMYELGVKVPKELEMPLEYINASGQGLALPPEVPQDRIDYLRRIFEKLSANPEVQNDLVKLTGAPSPFMPGKDLQAKVAALKANKALADQLDAIFSKRTATQ